MSQDLSLNLEEIEAKIRRENSILQGFKAMMCAHLKRDLRSQCEDGIRQSETILAFFRSEREKLKGFLSKKDDRDAEDFRKHNPPLSREMVAFRMREIQHKLLIEERVLEALNKYTTTAANDNVLTSKESQLEAMLKRAITSEEDSKEIVPNQHGIRHPVSGLLTIKLLAEQNLAHIEDCELSVLLQIDGTTRGQPIKLATCDRRDEHFRVEVVRANEMEMLVVAQGCERASLVGLLWIPLNEIADEVRRRAQNPSWAPADATGRMQPTLSSPEAGESPVIEDWFKLEPAGKLLLRIGKRYRGGVKTHSVWAGASRCDAQGWAMPGGGDGYGPLGPVHRQVYRLLACPVCRKLVINSTELQCQDCGFFCHTACAQLVRAKCITSTDQSKRQSLTQIYNIPHRFEGSVGLASHWCCHCGKLLSFVSSNGRCCVECDLACHTACQHLVPNFCGMTQEMADQLLRVDRVKVPVLASPNFSVATPPLLPPKSPLREIKMPPKSPLREIKMPPKSLLRKSLHLDIHGSTTHPPESFLRASVLPSATLAPPLTFKSAPVSPSASQFEFKARRELGLGDLKLLAVLGRGNFGKVLLAEMRATSKLVAVKVLKKDAALQNEDVEALLNEKEVFVRASKANHPFLVKLHACFQTPSAVVFVMDYVMGGDLMSLIQRRGRFLPEQAQFYCAEIVLALEFLHQQSILYRDLKLDNVLIDASGHIKVADYGLCKPGMGYGVIATTFCGTPEFMAPEILEDQKYGLAVDWWTLGVLLYQMILGQSPFTGKTDMEIFESILQDEVLLPTTLPRATASVLQELLTRDPNLRLGGGFDDATAVKAHEYFRGVDWAAYSRCEVTPPYVPPAAHPSDTANFDAEFTTLPPTITPSNSLLSPSQQAHFDDFSFVAD
ncbi:Serine/threonine kinase [Massospora cicadina]|nr:Serine/threonine kinase [Massospora cicadina]